MSTGDLPPGLYESPVSDALQRRLEAVDRDLVSSNPLRAAESADRISQHLARQIARALEALPEADRVSVGVDVARRLLRELGGDESEALTGKQLNSVGTRRPDGSVRVPASPLIPLLDTTLLTNAPGEPTVGSQIRTEIESADSIDLVMAFIRRSGLLPLQAALRAHCEQGKPLRVLTTTYTGSTEAKALDLLIDLGAEVRVSYDLTGTRLHAKAWLFHRRSGFSTAYVGSSNLTHMAQVDGVEWNVRVSGARNPDVVTKIQAVFDSYWLGGDYVAYDPAVFAQALAGARRSETPVLSPLEVRLEPFQERLLELIAVSRAAGHHRNLLVSATGTGKTVMAAVDYARLRATLPRARLLFVAHREEILDQSVATFRHVMRDHTFGQMWVGRARPTQFEHVFASVQSLAANGLAELAADHFDVVIVDEFHHAAAPSYRRLLDLVRPRELLGLTATPERADGLPVLGWFDDRIAAELRLWDAIDQHRLVPFVYYGIHDGSDLTSVPWRRGQGYDVTALTNVYTGNDAWLRFVLQQVLSHVDDASTMRCLGFCVSVEHARFMAARFTEHGIDAVAVSGDSTTEDRRDALRGLADGRIRVVFSVDLFNEGVDIPAVDVVLMLRPTESATLFLQQLGRGLRIAPGKTTCTVLDFVGTHRREFRFDLRYRALLGGTRSELKRAVEAGFPFLPAGCHLELDRVASDIVLNSLRDAIPSTWRAKADELRAMSRSRTDVTLADYLAETGLELGDVYSNDRSWSDLKAEAGLTLPASGPHETVLRRGVSRMLHVDDAQRLDAVRHLLSRGAPPDVDELSPVERSLARMLVLSLADQTLTRQDTLQVAVDLVWAHPAVRAELLDLAPVLRRKIDHLHASVDPEIPLQIHARYTRLEILAAAGEGTGAKTPQWREGVYDAKDIGADLLAFTLDKTSGGFSPTTRYRDYALSRDRIHWESQSTTRAQSPTGLRYQQHESMGRSIWLFARHRAEDRAFWFLGAASYVSHEGERPMAVTWRLHTPLSGDLYASLAAAVA